ERTSTFLGFIDGLVSNPHSSADVSSLYPARRQAAHTMQSVIFTATKNSQKQVRPDLSALLFSIYLAAVTSLCSPEVHFLLGQAGSLRSPHVSELGKYTYMSARSWIRPPSPLCKQCRFIW